MHAFHIKIINLSLQSRCSKIESAISQAYIQLRVGLLTSVFMKDNHTWPNLEFDIFKAPVHNSTNAIPSVLQWLAFKGEGQRLDSALTHSSCAEVPVVLTSPGAREQSCGSASRDFRQGGACERNRKGCSCGGSDVRGEALSDGITAGTADGLAGGSSGAEEAGTENASRSYFKPHDAEGGFFTLSENLQLSKIWFFFPSRKKNSSRSLFSCAFSKIWENRNKRSRWYK